MTNETMLAIARELERFAAVKINVQAEMRLTAAHYRSVVASGRGGKPTLWQRFLIWRKA